MGNRVGPAVPLVPRNSNATRGYAEFIKMSANSLQTLQCGLTAPRDDVLSLSHSSVKPITARPGKKKERKKNEWMRRGGSTGLAPAAACSVLCALISFDSVSKGKRRRPHASAWRGIPRDINITFHSGCDKQPSAACLDNKRGSGAEPREGGGG